MKRFLSILTAIALCLCTFTMTLTAAEPIDSTGLINRFTIFGNIGSLYATLSITGDYDGIGIYEYSSGYANFDSGCSISGYIYGIYATGKSTVVITGGSYTSNYVGIYINNSNVTFNLSGAPVISGNSYTSGNETVNCNVYLDDGALITLGEMTGGSVGVTTNTKPTSGNPIQITIAETTTKYYETAVDYIFSDDPNYMVLVNEENGYLELSVPKYKVTADTEIENGSVAISSKSAEAGETVTVTPTAAESYEVETVTYTYYNGTEYITTTIDLTNGAYSFTMPEYAVTVNVTFKKSTYSVITSSTTNGTVTVDNPNASMGDIVTITATANSLYKVKEVTVTDSAGNKLTITDNGDGTYSFTMPAGTVTVSVTFYQYTSAISGIIYINEQYHGVFINGHLASIPHTVDENGYCTVCHEYIGVATEETADITEEIVEIDEPVEAGETDVE